MAGPSSARAPTRRRSRPSTTTTGSINRCRCSTWTYLLAARARQLRLLLQAQPERRVAARPVPAEDAPPAGLAYAVSIDHRRPAGHLPGRAPQQASTITCSPAPSFVFYSMPVFWLGIILIVIFSGALHWFPPRDRRVHTSTDHLQSVELADPARRHARAGAPSRSFSRYMRSSTLENMVQDYVRTAQGKGASTRGCCSCTSFATR